MADFSNIKQEIISVIHDNQLGEITAEKLRDLELDIIDSINREKQDVISDLSEIRQKANGAYQKPQGGISKTDLATEVQTSLDKADTALQQHQDISGKVDKVQNATPNNFASFDSNGGIKDSGHKHSDYATSQQGEKADTAYQKPTGGIPITDLESDVKNSLGKADTAVQPSALSSYATQQEVQQGLLTKLDTINDLSTIRSGAAAGATAVQPADITNFATKTELNTGLASKQNTINASNTISSDFVDDTNKTNKFVTTEEKNKINNSIQGVKKGNETLTPENGVVTIPSDIESAQATSIPSTQVATATIDNNHILQLGIPRGADAVNPFKGWYDNSSNLPANPVVGDYAYVKGATAADPIAIYECTTNGTWSDSGRTADTSNVQTFASSQEVCDVHIVNDLTTGGVDDVLSAEQGKKIELTLKTTPKIRNSNDADFKIADSNGCILAEFKDGGFKVKKFDTQTAIKSVEVIDNNLILNI